MSGPDSPAWRLRGFITSHMQGGCRMLSIGSACTCPLCDLGRLYDALRWYESEAKSIQKHQGSAAHSAPSALLASMTVLGLDGGRRAEEALGPPVELNGDSPGQKEQGQ